jgi:hypothetical protein
MLGAALTAEGEVWVWGEALGRHKPALPALQFGSHLLNQVGVPVNWGNPGLVIYQTPVRLEHTDPDGGRK